MFPGIWVGVCLIQRFRMGVHMADPKPCSPAAKNKTTKHPQTAIFSSSSLFHFIIWLQTRWKRKGVLLPQMPAS